MLLNKLENTSIKREDESPLNSRSIFTVQVKAIEGDPSWEEYRKQLMYNDTSSDLIKNRTMDKGTGRIIFYLPEADNLKIANPLLPRVYNLFPMVGEMVKVIAYDVVENDICFDYVGPIIPSLINANQAFESVGKRNLDTMGNFSDTDPIIDFQSTNNDIKQIYPSTRDIGFQGRGNGQILIRKLDLNTSNPNEYVIIRSGMFTEITPDKIPTYNEQSAFVKVTTEPDPKIGSEYVVDGKTEENSNYIKHIYKDKYDPNAETTPKKSNEIKTRIDVVAQKINLFTYPNNRDEVYSIPYAELLFQYLANLQTWAINHKHGIDGTVAQDPNQKLGGNLCITDKGFISIPGKGAKLALTKDIKIV
jgi:hypothetical protein